MSLTNNDKRGRGRRVLFAAAGALCLTLSAFTAGCDRIPEGWRFWQKKADEPSGTVIARVGGAVLTLEDLQASIPQEYADVITQAQNIAYVRQWINTELLYQEALRLKVDHNPDIIARFEKMKKDLLSAEIINRGLADGVAEVGEQAVREYYESNREQFVRESGRARYEDIVVSDINLAWEIRRTATHETFRDMAKANPAILFVGNPDGAAPFADLETIPPVVRNAIAAASVPSITGPYRSEDGFHILRLINKFEKGTIATLEEVREEIVSRLSNQTQKGETERMIADIRARADVEFNIDLVPGVDIGEDTTEHIGQD